MAETTKTKQFGPIYNVELISSLPLGKSMRQALPTHGDLAKVRRTNERVVAGYEVLLAHYQRAMRVVEYLDNPEVLLKMPQPHRMRLSELLHDATLGMEERP